MEGKTVYWEKLLARAGKLAKRIEKDPDSCVVRMSNLILEMSNAMAEKKEES